MTRPSCRSGMRRLRMTGTRTVGAGTTVEPRRRSGREAVAARRRPSRRAAAAGAAPTAAAPGAAAPAQRRSSPRPRRHGGGAGCRGAGAAATSPRPRSGRCLAARRTRRWRGPTFCVSSETGGRRRLLVDRARPRARSPAALDPAAAIAVAPAAAPGPSRLGPSPSALGAANAASYSADRREHRQPGRRREGPRRRVGRHDREAPVVDDRLARQQPEVHPGGAIRDPYGITSATFVASEPRILAAAEVISSSTSR